MDQPSTHLEYRSSTTATTNQPSPANPPFFVLKATNYQVIGTSQMYVSTEGRDNVIASCKINGPTTVVHDLTELTV